ncbi:error-prone DNA polymerase [Ditylenchus destructor]|nr:error-prone DNA polymerase [Ditylenchus destructor]
MAAWRRKGGIEKYYAKIVDGMTTRGYERAFAKAIFEQIKGFSEYGFPESHAASFALLVYTSSWLKRHRPAEFFGGLAERAAAGVLFAQPAGAGRQAQPRGGAAAGRHAQRLGLHAGTRGRARDPADAAARGRRRARRAAAGRGRHRAG